MSIILIFNAPGLLFLFFGGLGAWVVGFSLWALGLDEGGFPWVLISFCAITAAFDIACRYSDALRTESASLRLVRPSAGGQLFFIPVWILTVALLIFASVTNA